jgi:phosphatidylserine synthase
MSKHFVLVVIVVCLLLSAVFFGLQQYDPRFRFSVLMGGNILMAALSLISYGMVKKQMTQRPEAFVRGVYGATFLKLMVCMVSILLYVMLDRKNIHKPSVFVLFGIYAVYTAIETWLLSKLAREAK